jgi:hypothetical protein
MLEGFGFIGREFGLGEDWGPTRGLGVSLREREEGVRATDFLEYILGTHDEFGPGANEAVGAIR